MELLGALLGAYSEPLLKPNPLLWPHVLGMHSQYRGLPGGPYGPSWEAHMSPILSSSGAESLAMAPCIGDALPI